MGKLLFIALVCLTLPACLSNTAAPALLESVTPEATAEAWFSLSVDGVVLDIHVLPGWEALPTEDGRGVSVVEHARLNDAAQPEGMLVNIFVPALSDIDLPDTGNAALHVLEHIAAQPDYVGSSEVSAPQAFLWDGHHAAYYLLGGDEGIDALVLALALPPHNQLVVWNIAAPHADAHRIRALLPDLLASLKINGAPLDIAALHHLPDPFHFPQIAPAATETDS